MQAKIAFAGTHSTSYRQAASLVTELFELPLTAPQVRRVCKSIGAERCAERDAETAAYAELPLVARKGVPDGAEASDVAVVGVDGGRLQIIDSHDDAAEESPDDDGEEPVNHGRHWREDKIGMMMAMTSDEHESDPCPEVPETFVDPLRILKLTRELKKSGPAPTDANDAAEADDDAADDDAAAEPQTHWKPPKVKAKSFVASRRPWSAFGPMVAAAAWQQGSSARRGRRSWATAPRRTGRCGGTTSRRSFRFWISSMRCRTCSRRRRRVGRSRRVGRCTCGGSARCGRAVWTR